jgi:hypothetical protein
MQINRFLLALSEPKMINTTASASLISTIVSFAERTLVIVQWIGGFLAIIAGILAIIGWFYDRFWKRSKRKAS